MHRKLFLLLGTAFLASMASPAGAVGIGPWECITDNDAGDCAIGEAQLSSTIVASGPNALLTITMSGPGAAVVEQVFIESAIVSGISFQGSVGVGTVAFGLGAAGGNLPGGNPIGFSEAWNIGAIPDPPLNGIGAHPQDNTSAQSAEFLLTLTGGDFADLLADLRVGVHVIGYDSGGSESFVTPEPATFLLLALGLTGLTLGAGSRRR